MTEPKTPEYVHAATKAKLEAEARFFDAQAKEYLLGVQEAKARLELTKMELEIKRETHRLVTNSDHYHRVLRFTKEVDGASTKEAIETLAKWDRIDPDCDITIIFTSPGGGVFSGYALYDFIVELKARHHVTTVARGYAASMAGILLQAGTTRKMGKESYLMLHEVSTLSMGKAFEIQDEAAFLEVMMGRVYDIFVERSGGKLTKAKLKKLVERRDFWVPSDEALKFGLVDEVEA